MKKNNISDQADDISNELISIYRELHSNPELSFKEYKTSEYIKNYLEGLGLTVKDGIAGTGITAILEGALPGRTIALRADIDALPIQENTTLSYKSKNEGIMHACAHDSHTTILLGVAKLLCKNINKLKGTIKFIFQPAEEISLGAKAMIREGVLKDPKVDIVLALHTMSHIKSGNVQVKAGLFLSAQDEFEIDIIGKGGHGANPQSTIDPIIIGAHLTTALQAIVSRKIDPTSPAVVSICQFISGTKNNIIPEKVYIGGTIRSQDKKIRKIILDQIKTITRGICLSFSADYKIKINPQLSFTINNKEIVNDFIDKSLDIVEMSDLEILEKAYMYGEDFSYFGQAVPSMMFFLGTYNEEKGCIYPMHSSKFMLDENILPIGTALITNYCLKKAIN